MGREAADRVKNLPPMADGLNSDLLEVIDCQTRQYLKVDTVVVVPERLLIGLQAQTAQQLSNVQLGFRRPLNGRFFSFVYCQAADRCADGWTF
jgi:hypothetical protein